MKRLNNYINEKLVISKDLKRTYIYSGSYDKNARHICWLFGRINKSEVNDNPFPDEDEYEESFGPLSYMVYKWIKEHDVKSYKAIADKKTLKELGEDNDVIDYFEDNPEQLQKIISLIKNNRILAQTGRYSLIGSELNLLLYDYKKGEEYSKLIVKM